MTGQLPSGGSPGGRKSAPVLNAGWFSGPVDQYVSFDALAAPGIQKECGREVAAVTAPSAVIGTELVP